MPPEDWEALKAQAMRWVEEANAGDAEAAFSLGMFHLDHAPLERLSQAQDWFWTAARLGGPDLLWRAADACVPHYLGSFAEVCRHQAVASMSDPAGVRLDGNTFAFRVDSEHNLVLGQDWAFVVRADDPAQGPAVREVLERVSRRFSWIAEDGTDLEQDESPLDDRYTPNAVWYADFGNGPGLVADCKGDAYPLMGRTVLRILIEELRQSGVIRAQIEPAGDAKTRLDTWS